MPARVDEGLPFIVPCVADDAILDPVEAVAECRKFSHHAVKRLADNRLDQLGRRAELARSILDRLADVVDRLQRLLAGADQHRVVEREAEMAKPARFRRIVMAQVRQIAIEPVVLEVDVAAMAGGQESFAHRCRQSLIGADLMAGPHVGKLVAAPCPVRGGGVPGSHALSGEMIDEEQSVLVGQVGRQVGAFRGESDIHGAVPDACSEMAPHGGCLALISSTSEPGSV